MDEQEIIKRTVTSECFKAEAAYVRRGGIETSTEPRMLKRIDDRFVRTVFPTSVKDINDGLIVAMVCLWDEQEQINVYAHCISAGPGVNAQLRALYSPLGQVKPQPGVEGDKAVTKFIAWKQASWGKFLNEELELGTTEASQRWLASFWKALDRMYGGGNLRG
ncbi:hypothetical protein [uncultured Ilyobacter sp.]|uniref:hypothetical protein n=1 Tax=uncultured Ilyobacter sp. TaxID=544433 RepID=UPI0029F487ED|nr:hypothetical protein [uncultured Ilyobacter sp.]